MKFSIQGTEIDPEIIQPLQESDRSGSIDEMRQGLSRDGYIFLRNFFDPYSVDRAQNSIFSALEQVDEVSKINGFTVATGRSRRPSPENDNGNFWRSVSEDKNVRSVTHAQSLKSLFDRLFAEASVAFDFVWVRVMPPGLSSPLHFDHVYMNRGSDKVLSVWIPFSKVYPQNGSLFIIEKSNRFEDLIDKYRGVDVDRMGFSCGAVNINPITLAKERKKSLLTSNFEPGDILIFEMFLLHASFDNNSPTKEVRFSCDVRYQPESGAKDNRWFGVCPAGHNNKSYAGMSSAQPLTLR